jgi:uncharacterized protein
VSREATPESPCVGICLLDPAAGLRRGCLRTVEEIASWYEASTAEKRAILVRLDRRQLDGRFADDHS